MILEERKSDYARDEIGGLGEDRVERIKSGSFSSLSIAGEELFIEQIGVVVTRSVEGSRENARLRRTSQNFQWRESMS